MIRLRECCSEIGQPIPTGSYFLDLMMYPDIDLYLPFTSPGALLSVAAKLAAHDCVKKVDSAKGGPAELADGLYLKLYIEHGTWERPWKIDIWSLPPHIIDRKQAELVDLRDRMTCEQRHLILHFKYSVLTDAGPTPMFSGIHIYWAVVDLGLTDSEEISNYLRENGIEA